MKMHFRHGDASLFAVDSDQVPVPGDQVNAFIDDKFVPYVVESRRWFTDRADWQGYSRFDDVVIFCRPL